MNEWAGNVPLSPNTPFFLLSLSFTLVVFSYTSFVFGRSEFRLAGMNARA